KKISKKIRIISESEVESLNADSNNDNEYTLAQNIPLPPSHSSSETETASENENNNRESYPQRTASVNNNVEEQSLPVINTIDDNNRIPDINNQILQINNSSGSEEGINNIIIATAEFTDQKKIAKTKDTTTSVFSDEIAVVNTSPTENESHNANIAIPRNISDNLATRHTNNNCPLGQLSLQVQGQEKITIRRNEQIVSNIKEITDSIEARKDNLICFLYTDGSPMDNAGRIFIEKGWLPPPAPELNLDMSYIKTNFLRNKIIFGLVLGRKDKPTIEEDDLNLALKNLIKKMTEMNVKTASVSQGMN
ncbi:hypothetical protein PV325_014081, partial [Microctonus aethiopoides]